MKAFSTFILTLIVPLSAAQAQDARPPAPGARVRVSNARVIAIGVLESVDAAAIVVRRGDTGRVTIPMTPDTRVDVSARPGSCGAGRQGTCAVVGMLVGGGLGLGVAAIVASRCYYCGHKSYAAAVPVGAFAGGLIGHILGAEHWHPAALPGTVGLSPTYGGPGRRLRLQAGYRLEF